MHAHTITTRYFIVSSELFYSHFLWLVLLFTFNGFDILLAILQKPTLYSTPSTLITFNQSLLFPTNALNYTNLEVKIYVV